MPKARTGAERYLNERRGGTDYDLAYQATRRRIDQIDSIIRVLDQRRCNLDLSKAELARRAKLRPEVVRRLFSAESPNPTLSTLVALAEALEMKLAAEPLEVNRDLASREPPDAVRTPSGIAGPSRDPRSA